MKYLIPILIIVSLQFLHIYPKCLCPATQYFSISEKKCIEDTTFCLKRPDYDDQNSCDGCLEGYQPYQGSQCIKKTLSNCIFESKTYQEKEPTCSICEDGYDQKEILGKPNAYECIPYPKEGEDGYIQNCKQYLSSGGCFKCDDGCYKDYSGGAPCVKVEGVAIIQGCQVYDKSYYGNTITCETCDTKGYSLLKDGQCVPTKDVHPNCLQYLSEKCTSCVDGFYSDSQFICQPNPTNDQVSGYIANCKKYSYEAVMGAIECVECLEKHIMQKSSEGILGCVLLTEEQKIDNCIKYQWYDYGQSWYCVECEDNFYMNNEYLTSSSCDACPVISTPTNPTDPSNPSDPNNPTAPGTNPSDPSNPTDPGTNPNIEDDSPVVELIDNTPNKANNLNFTICLWFLGLIVFI